MENVTIQVPENRDLSEKELVTMLAAQLYDMGKLSLGQAAEMVGYTKPTFMELLANYGVSIFNYSPDELDNDLVNAKNCHL